LPPAVSTTADIDEVPAAARASGVASRGSAANAAPITEDLSIARRLTSNVLWAMVVPPLSRPVAQA
jgi:hypothetical protein